MSIEAMKQALEALEEYQANGAPFMSCDAAVLVLRDAIEQAEKQEPVAQYSDIISDGGMDPRNVFDAQSQRDWSLLEATQESLREHMAEIKRLKQRSWIGLTEEDLEKVFPAISTYHEANKTLYRSIARAIEAKLKEKNTWPKE